MRFSSNESRISSYIGGSLVELKFENGSKIRSIDSGTNKRSIRGIEELRQRINEFGSIFDDIYFLVYCIYNAKTELYDRRLTNMRSEHDPTEAFIGCNSYVKGASNCYSKKLYEKCRTYIEIKTYPSTFDCKHWRNCIRYYHNLSAQGWIALYERLVKEGHISEEILEFCEPYLSRKGE